MFVHGRSAPEAEVIVTAGPAPNARSPAPVVFTGMGPKLSPEMVRTPPAVGTYEAEVTIGAS